MAVKMKDWTGHKFGYLTVIKFNTREIKNKRQVYTWLCHCICGTKMLKDIVDLKKGSTRSCGCLTKKLQSDSKIKPNGVAAFNNLFYRYKMRCAKERRYDFSLTKDEFKKLTSDKCYYCNISPSTKINSKISFYMYNGIDRLDNSKGYIIDNCVPCCKSCNSKKSGITKEMIYKLYHRFFIYES